MPSQSPAVRWSLKVSAETDIDRTYLAQRGTTKGDISKFCRTGSPPGHPSAQAGRLVNQLEALARVAPEPLPTVDA